MFNLRGPTRAEPEGHLWSADHSMRNACVSVPNIWASVCWAVGQVRRGAATNLRQQQACLHFYEDGDSRFIQNGDTYMVDISEDQNLGTRVSHLPYQVPARHICRIRYLRVTFAISGTRVSHLSYQVPACNICHIRYSRVTFPYQVLACHICHIRYSFTKDKQYVPYYVLYFPISSEL
jgi:hypothetical protein